jgi:hypothetical protein
MEARQNDCGTKTSVQDMEVVDHGDHEWAGTVTLHGVVSVALQTTPKTMHMLQL